jgi:hypothetical protein
MVGIVCHILNGGTGRTGILSAAPMLGGDRSKALR